MIILVFLLFSPLLNINYIFCYQNVYTFKIPNSVLKENKFSYQYPFEDPSLSWNERTDDLIERLTIDEIVPQTMAIYGSFTPGIKRLNIHPYVWITECLHGQPDTNTTAFPQSLGLAASFNARLIHQISEAISYEVRAHWNNNRKKGIYQMSNGLSCFSPVINILRHPLWGRNQETYGEDPYLSGKLAQAFVRGLQGKHPRYIRANAGCKHFDVHGGPENIPVTRYSFDSKLSEADWRMTFLPQFKMCVEAGTYSLMCSYNSINGIPACANKKLLTSITRNEWNFTGYIVSDAGAISNIIDYHKYLKSNTQTVAATIHAGCNLELGSDVYNYTSQAIKEGFLTEKEVRLNARPLFYTRMRLGEFDPEHMNIYNYINISIVQCAKHRYLAMKAAMQSIVLLKNNGDFLPLKNKFSNIALIGPFVNNTSEYFGSYSSLPVPKFTKTLSKTLSKLALNHTIIQGCDSVTCDKYDREKVASGVKDNDLIVLTLGVGSSHESESNDRKNMDLPGKQIDLLRDIIQIANVSNKKVILLLFNAGPLDIKEAKQSPNIQSILECFYPAQAAADALYHLILANMGPNSVPAARLPNTWPAYLEQVPSIINYNMSKGHTYRYFKGDPLYPFGYGLSYTQFSYISVKLSSNQIIAGSIIFVEVVVKNIGDFTADEVIQIYISWPHQAYKLFQNIPIPKLQLVAFDRIQIKTKQKKKIKILIKPERYAVWGEKGWFHIPGNMSVFVGGQQPNQLTKAPSNVLQTFFIIK